MSLRIVGFLLCVSILFQPIIVAAFETDQYNLPPVPLADIGDEVTDYTERNIREAIEKINQKIVELERCAEKPDQKCDVSKKEIEKLAYLRSEDAIAKAVFKEMGDGIIPFTKSSWWLEGHKFREANSRYKTNFKDSIYITAPFNYLTISSTIRVYGTEFGSDKIAHIFQQGYDYFKIYKKGLKKGLTEKEATKKAIKWGQKTEKTYFGYWVSGVYSNADLYSNYAGLKFYLGLTRDIQVGNEVRKASVSLHDGIWIVNENAGSRESLLKPFISNHLNEAYNPNKFFNVLKFRKVIRKIVREKSCKQWFDRYPNMTKAEMEAATKSLELWNDEDYGFTPSEKFITIANTCFDNDPKVEAADQD